MKFEKNKQSKEEKSDSLAENEIKWDQLKGSEDFVNKVKTLAKGINLNFS